MNKPTITDILTTILGVLIMLWAIAFYTYSKITGEIDFPPLDAAIAVSLSLFLIWFKGDAARAILSKLTAKIKKQ